MLTFTVIAPVEETALVAEYAGVDCDIEPDDTNDEVSVIRINETHASQMLLTLDLLAYRFFANTPRATYSDPTFARAAQRESTRS